MINVYYIVLYILPFSKVNLH